MKRSKFLKRAALITVTVPFIPLVSCSNNSDPTPPSNPNPDQNCLENGTTTSITTNHGHGLVVPKEDVEDGVGKTYAIRGTATHDHMVTITAGQFSSLKSNNSIDVTSTAGDGHTHQVTVSCA